jgi:hypothetical protein
MEFFTAATALAIPTVLIITELAKLIPINFTSKYPAWVNGILSVIAACIIVLPTFTFISIGQVIGTALFIAVVAAIAYNQWTSHLKAKTE